MLLMHKSVKSYSHPIASREEILALFQKANKPLRQSDIAKRLKMKGERDETALHRRLTAMVRDGQLLLNRDERYLMVHELEMHVGTVIAHPDGFGFFRRDTGGDDIFLGPKQMRRVLHGDRALVASTGEDHRGRHEGRITEVLERAHSEIVGQFVNDRGITSVLPSEQRIHLDVLIPPGEAGEAQPGEMVRVELIEQPGRRTPPIGRVVEVLGASLAPGMAINVAIHSHKLPHEWSEDAVAQAKQLGESVTESDKRQRLDLRDKPFVTIDGEDAKDFDDAVYCHPTRSGFKLWVAIADVAHYVEPDSALDHDAYARATSVYFPGRVLPMLPESLSNGLCSLKPDVDRLAMVCEMLIDKSGITKSVRFHNALICSHARLTYTQVAAALEGKKGGAAQTTMGHLMPHLNALHALYGVLRAARDKRGAVEFDFPEPRIVLDDEGQVERIETTLRNDAHCLIEECMIAANVAAANKILKHKLPALLRVHEGVNPDRVEDLRAFLALRGVHLGGGERPGVQDFRATAAQIQGRADAPILQLAMLRAMNQAVYAESEKGHFGLALEHYAHFTSPIRRYPDLVIHRTLKSIVAQQPKSDFLYSAAQVQAIGEQCSTFERRADEAVRDVVDTLKCQYMVSRVGEELSGRVNAVTHFGMFIMLDGLFVEGLVHISNLPNDYYVHDSASATLTGRRSGRRFGLGDAVRVVVAQVNVEERKIDLQLLDEKKQAEKRSEKRDGKRDGKRSGKR